MCKNIQNIHDREGDASLRRRQWSNAVRRSLRFAWDRGDHEKSLPNVTQDDLPNLTTFKDDQRSLNEIKRS